MQTAGGNKLPSRCLSMQAEDASSKDNVNDDNRDEQVVVPTMHVQLVEGVKFLPHHGTKVQVQTHGDCITAKNFLVESDSHIADLGLSIEPTLLEPKNGTA